MGSLLAELIFAVMTANILIFSALGAATWSAARREPILAVASAMRAVSLVSWAFVLGSATQLTLVALRLGWLPDGLEHSVTGPWHLAQSLAIMGVAGTVAVLILRTRRLAGQRRATRVETPSRSAPR